MVCYAEKKRLDKHLNSPMKKCECSPECPVMIHSLTTFGKPAKYKHGHQPKGYSRKTTSPHRVYRHGDYNYIKAVGHPNSDYKGRIGLHVYNFTTFYQCCMLPWGVVHHKIPVNKGGNNDIPNLEGMTARQHGKHHNPENDISKTCRRIDCPHPKKTTVRKNGFHQWYGNEIDGWLCSYCYAKEYKERIR